MKPLELTISPPVDDSPSWPEYRIWFRDRMAERDAAEAKHLTDAELAAEYHASETEAWRDSAIYLESETTAQIEHRSTTLHRFATNPHYCEEAA